ncbi:MULTISPECIES: hypothetical protein [Silvimonas]|uniref:hypothetical protein n=1 Tax=Silvimonas TaxID=300264 RepID=UPI0024B393F4|nr:MULTISPECIES: hypothetical protein [Silvimonas]MDR3428167.1 hypothetical protein [Silvimonas sp.]
MSHSHSDHASHSHAHSHATAVVRPGLPARLFAFSAAQRLLIALVPLALVWFMTWWAL